MCVPSKKMRRKIRRAMAQPKIIPLVEIDNVIPKDVLDKIESYDNAFYYKHNSEILVGGGGYIEAFLSLIPNQKIPNPRLILGLLCASKMRLSHLRLA